MDWDAIGAIGEIVGALAVFGSLLFLGLQIRSQNRESKFAAMHETSVAFRDSISQSVDPAIAQILVKAGEDYDSISDSEKLVVTGFVQRLMRVWEESFLQHEQGRLPDRIWNVMVSQFSTLMDSPTTVRVWKARKAYYDPAFQEFVESIQVTPYSVPGVERWDLKSAETLRQDKESA
ncbi:MAG: hypothetical protein AB8B81_14370 [Halioglobus sp.]